MAKVYLLLGTDLGNKETNLQEAVSLLEQKAGKVVQLSSVYESEAWGFESKTTFYNQAVCIETDLQPEQLLEVCLAIETELGRERTGGGYQSRIIDIDILLYGTVRIETDHLTIPHPKLPNRLFALLPLVEINTADVIETMIADCNDEIIPRLLQRAL